ncbi:hypothetical protein HY732_05315 [Candidatus Uhrbacteria bacterium]|nr:hypothetical protein [Candidatus Uhrbacteria bacterium]
MIYIMSTGGEKLAKIKVRLSKKGKDVQLFAAAQGAGANIEVERMPNWSDHEWSQFGDNAAKKSQERKEGDEQK